MISEEYRKRLQKANYKIIGKNQHSAVKLCLWCKKSIKSGEKEVCYKQQFYGIKSHRCLQMTPALPFCNLRCAHCWRDTTTASKEWKGEIDPAEEIIEASIKAQRELLTGLGGTPHSEVHLKEAMNPNQVAISLEGEPMMYPYIDDLIRGYKARGFTTFLVTNGTLPERIESLSNLPDQLYVSLTSSNKEMFERLQKPVETRLWSSLLRSLELLSNLKTRRVIRLTLIKGVNDKNVEEFARLIEKSSADFVEVKSYMAVGYSTLRLKYENMPSFADVMKFAEDLNKILKWYIEDKNSASRVVLIKNPRGCKRFLGP